jgi:hypothetical protein
VGGVVVGGVVVGGVVVGGVVVGGVVVGGVVVGGVVVGGGRSTSKVAVAAPPAQGALTVTGPGFCFAGTSNLAEKSPVDPSTRTRLGPHGERSMNSGPSMQ